MKKQVKIFEAKFTLTVKDPQKLQEFLKKFPDDDAEFRKNLKKNK